MVRMIRFTLLAAIVISLASCATETSPVPVMEKSNLERGPNVRVPITQIRQTLNLKPDETFRQVFATLQRRSIGLNSIDEQGRSLETTWVNVTDSMCGGHRPQQAPLSCRTRMSFKVEGYDVSASILHIRYEEYCSVNEQVPLECPDSSAERLMLAILEEIKSSDKAPL